MAANVAEANSLRVIAVRPRRWPTVVVALLLLGMLAFIAYSFATSKNIKWDGALRYLAAPSILKGLVLTVQFTVLSMIGGICLGVIAGAARLSANALLRITSTLYIWIFRGTPLLVQVILLFNLALVFPMVGIGPVRVSTNTIMSSFVAGLLALTLNEGAYMAEIVRGGILSVDSGQTEAALSIGLTKRQTLMHIILPQALRFIVPATGNQLNAMIKATSLVSVIAADELLTQAEAIYSRTFLVIELLLVASFWYLVLTTVVAVGQGYIERRLGQPRNNGASNVGWTARLRAVGMLVSRR